MRGTFLPGLLPDHWPIPQRHRCLSPIKEVVLNDDECRLGRPRLARLSSVQQAEAVELLARLLLDAATDKGRRHTGRPAGTLRRLTPNPARRSR